MWPSAHCLSSRLAAQVQREAQAQRDEEARKKRERDERVRLVSRQEEGRLSALWHGHLHTTHSSSAAAAQGVRCKHTHSIPIPHLLAPPPIRSRIPSIFSPFPRHKGDCARGSLKTSTCFPHSLFTTHFPFSAPHFPPYRQGRSVRGMQRQRSSCARGQITNRHLFSPCRQGRSVRGRQRQRRQESVMQQKCTIPTCSAPCLGPLLAPQPAPNSSGGQLEVRVPHHRTVQSHLIVLLSTLVSLVSQSGLFAHIYA